MANNCHPYLPCLVIAPDALTNDQSRLQCKNALELSICAVRRLVEFERSGEWSGVKRSGVRSECEELLRPWTCGKIGRVRSVRTYMRTYIYIYIYIYIFPPKGITQRRQVRLARAMAHSNANGLRYVLLKVIKRSDASPTRRDASNEWRSIMWTNFGTFKLKFLKNCAADFHVEHTKKFLRNRPFQRCITHAWRIFGFLVIFEKLGKFYQIFAFFAHFLGGHSIPRKTARGLKFCE